MPEEITVRLNTRIAETHGEEALESITIDEDGVRSTIPATALFVFVGAEPHTDWLGTHPARSDRGFLLTGAQVLNLPDECEPWPLERHPLALETSIPGVFAAGDVRDQSIKRVASAVGEGSMAVLLVHPVPERALAWTRASCAGSPSWPTSQTRSRTSSPATAGSSSWRRGEYLFREGEEAAFLSLLLEGELETTRSIGGDELPLIHHEPGGLGAISLSPAGSTAGSDALGQGAAGGSPSSQRHSGRCSSRNRPCSAPSWASSFP